jgi:hypothetical protein
VYNKKSFSDQTRLCDEIEAEQEVKGGRRYNEEDPRSYCAAERNPKPPTVGFPSFLSIVLER